MLVILRLTICYLLLLDCYALYVPPRVKTPYGRIRGYKFTAESGFEALIFKSLPYAKPPVGHLRWKKPEKPDNWEDEIDGTNPAPANAQTVSDQHPKGGYSEDSLYVNVYTSQKCIDSKKGCAIVYYIHGGALVYDSAVLFEDGPIVNSFPKNDIVAVTVEFRQGIFGTLALGDENLLPSNIAMHDCIAGLKFTREVVGSFGGDVDRLTIMGHSSGAMMVDLLVFSPGINKPDEPPMFSSVVAMSNMLGLQDESIHIAKSRIHAKEAGCTGSASEILACLNTKNTTEMCNAQARIGGTRPTSERQLGRIILAGELFPIREQEEMFENTGPFRLMVGTNTRETDMNNKSSIEWIRLMGYRNREEVYSKFLADEASGEYDNENHTMNSLAFFHGTWQVAHEHAKNGREVYLYQYEYPAHPFHSQDLNYILGIHGFERDANEQWLSRIYPMYFANFIKGHPPAPDWVPFNIKDVNYYSINKAIGGKETPHMENNYQPTIRHYFGTVLREYDANITRQKRMKANIAVEYHALAVESDGVWDGFLSAFTWPTLFFVLMSAALVFLAGCCCGRCTKRTPPPEETMPLLLPTLPYR